MVSNGSPNWPTWNPHPKEGMQEVHLVVCVVINSAILIGLHDTKVIPHETQSFKIMCTLVGV